MKVLLFTHEADIDGMGSAIIGSLAFNDFDYVLCETHLTNLKVKEYILNKSIYNYDLIFVTDLCVRGEVISLIQNDEYLKTRFIVLDHHKSEISEDTLNADFINIVIEDDKGKCSGTSLFYEYVVSNKYLIGNDNIDYLVELIRQYDTWEWKTKYNNYEAVKLKVLFDILGKVSFISNIVNKLKSNEDIFSLDEIKLIDEKIDNTNIKVKDLISTIIIKEIDGLNVGIIFNMIYEFRNEVAEYLNENNYNIDYVMLEMKEKNSVSFRSINNNIDVSEIASILGGKGHKEAASCPITDKFYEYIK